MKKTLFIGLAAAAMLASCSKDQVIERAPQENPVIGFSSFVDNSTKATDLTKDNLTDFGVYGFMESIDGIIFDNERVYKKDDGTWTYDNTQYWTGGKTYWFSAIAPRTDAKWEYAHNDNVAGGIITFTNDGSQDLLYAYNGAIECTDPANQDVVGFTFDHLLSRVKFGFTNEMGNENVTLKVREVTITNANTKATCDVSEAQAERTWTLATDNTTFHLIFGAAPVTDGERIVRSKKERTDHFYMIPQNREYTLNFIVDMYNGEVLADTFTHHGVTIPAVDMKPGFSYLFSTTLNAGNIDPEEELYPIEFTVDAVNDWEDFGDNNFDVPTVTPGA